MLSLLTPLPIGGGIYEGRVNENGSSRKHGRDGSGLDSVSRRRMVRVY